MTIKEEMNEGRGYAEGDDRPEHWKKSAMTNNQSPTLQEIKDQVAKEKGYSSWGQYMHMQWDEDSRERPLYDVVCERYASSQLQQYKEKLEKKLNNLSKTTHGRVFTTEVIELIKTTEI